MSQPIRVNVFAALADDDMVAFTHRWFDRQNRRVKGAIKVPQGASNVRIQFHLLDSTGLRLGFYGAGNTQSGDPIWVDANGCPEQPSTHPQISVAQNGITQNQLTIVDRNSGSPCTLYFTLRFTGEATDDGPPYEYDPEIRNGGEN